MAKKIEQTIPPPPSGRGTSGSYVAGYILSLILTVTAFILVANQVFSGRFLVLAIVELAIAQLLVQLLLFLHLDRESKPRWNLLAFLFAVLVVGILVFGSLWIMHNLNYHMSSPSEMDSNIIRDEGISR